jgi:hypothetical protein
MRKISPRVDARKIAATRSCTFHFAPCLPEPEQLVGLGFRYWILGRANGDVACWERAWRLYSNAFGVAGGKAAVTQLSAWVGALGTASRREIQVFPGACRSFCRDECVAISMIAACQHQTCPAMRACAFALAETSMIDRVVEQAQEFAETLTSLHLVLSPGSIINATAGMATEQLRLQ